MIQIRVTKYGDVNDTLVSYQTNILGMVLLAEAQGCAGVSITGQPPGSTIKEAVSFLFYKL